jgi:hypothetical protein
MFAEIVLIWADKFVGYDSLQCTENTIMIDIFPCSPVQYNCSSTC